MQQSQLIASVILELPKMKESHVPSSASYTLLKTQIKEEIISLFPKTMKGATSFPPFGKIKLPYFKMGAIDSLDLFGLDELIIFSFYWKNKEHYKNVLDIGGNIGLHSILLSLCNFKVSVYEPDPIHFEKLVDNLKLNNCKNVTAYNEAISNRNGTANFTRVLGNTTSSHISGSKQPYGELEVFSVPVRDIKDLVASVDLIKMDVEGHEKEILLDLTRDHWQQLDALVEIGSTENARQIFDHLKSIQVNAFSQKLGWEKVVFLEDMPTSHRDGSLFISLKTEMPWD